MLDQPVFGQELFRRHRRRRRLVGAPPYEDPQANLWDRLALAGDRPEQFDPAARILARAKHWTDFIEGPAGCDVLYEVMVRHELLSPPEPAPTVSYFRLVLRQNQLATFENGAAVYFGDCTPTDTMNAAPSVHGLPPKEVVTRNLSFKVSWRTRALNGNGISSPWSAYSDVVGTF